MVPYVDRQPGARGSDFFVAPQNPRFEPAHPGIFIVIDGVRVGDDLHVERRVRQISPASVDVFADVAGAKAIGSDLGPFARSRVRAMGTMAILYGPGLGTSWTPEW